jgi:hypothetical protein
MAETLVKVPGRQRLWRLVRQCRGDSVAVWNERCGAVGGGRADILLGPEAISTAGTCGCGGWGCFGGSVSCGKTVGWCLRVAVVAARVWCWLRIAQWMRASLMFVCDRVGV